MAYINQFLKLFILMLACIYFSTPWANASDYQSPRTAALGGAGHASPLLNDAIYLNPSFSSFMPVHSLTMNYLSFRGDPYDSPQGPSDYYGRNVNVSLFDGTADSLFQAGLGYTSRDDAALLHLGASKAILKKWGIGLAGKVLFPKEFPGERIVNGSLSFSHIPFTWLQVAFIADNLFSSTLGKQHGFNREYIFGTKVGYKNVIYIYADPHMWSEAPVGQSQWGYELGAEFPFFSDFFLRGGIFKNSNIPFQAQRGVLVGDGYGIGVGWLAPKLSLNYGYSRVRQSIPAYSHNFGFNIYF